MRYGREDLFNAVHTWHEVQYENKCYFVMVA